MKIKKIVLAFGILLSTFHVSNAQIVDKAKVLFYRHGLQQYPVVYSDSVTVTMVSGDTTWFNTSANNPSGKSYYIRAGSKVYRENFALGPQLYYDYSLVKDDTFVFDVGPPPDTFIVDSVYYKALNHRNFKAWHLTSIKDGLKCEWIEGLGELRRGWDTRGNYFIDAGWMVKGICLNDSVLYWDSAFPYFGNREPGPTCLFDSVSRALGTPDIVSKNKFNLYPNPALDLLTIRSKTDGKVSIMDMTGKSYLSEIPIQEGTHTIDVSSLAAGAYVVAIRYGNEIIHKKILILDNY